VDEFWAQIGGKPDPLASPKRKEVRALATPDVYICIRKTLDWQDESLVRKHILPEFRSKLEAWNATFDLPYHHFRQRLKEIAQRNHASVEGATCVPLDQATFGSLIVPVDDDDWFGPDLAIRLRAHHDPDARGYLWSREVIPERRRRRRWLKPRFLRRRRRTPRYTCATNNYALIHAPDARLIARAHTRASEWFDANPELVGRIPGVLAVQNRSLASQTALGWRRASISRDELVESFERYRGVYESWKPSRDLRWAQPYVDEMAALMKTIKLR
jgi:hypothetical protein